MLIPSDCNVTNNMAEIPIMIYRFSFPRHLQCLNFRENIGKGITINDENTITNITQCHANTEISLNQVVPKLRMADAKNIAHAGVGNPENPSSLLLFTLKRANLMAAKINNRKGENMSSILVKETYNISAVR